MPKTIPRELIPWFPSIASDRCNGCGFCLDFCPHGGYTRDKSSTGVVVRNPYDCVVGCNNCEDRCPERAIAFPDLEAVTEIIQKLRREE